MLKKKNLKYLSMVLVLVMLITMVVITTLPKSSVEHNSLQLSSDTVSEDEKIANTTENLYPFTNFDSVDGISVDDYITYNYSNSVSVKYDAIKVKYKMTINGSDDIIKFVPEEQLGLKDISVKNTVLLWIHLKGKKMMLLYPLLCL